MCLDTHLHRNALFLLALMYCVIVVRHTVQLRNRITECDVNMSNVYHCCCYDCMFVCCCCCFFNKLT